MNVIPLKRCPFWVRAAQVCEPQLVIIQNMHCGHLPRCHFVRTSGHHLKTIGYTCTLAFYIPNDLATIGDVAFRSISRPTLTHNFRTIRHIHVVAFYIPNKFSTVVDIPFQLKTPLLVTTGKLHQQTCIAIAFSYNIMCVLKHKWKLLVATTVPHTKRLPYYQRRFILR